MIKLLANSNDLLNCYPVKISLECWQERQDFNQTLLSKDFVISARQEHFNKMDPYQLDAKDHYCFLCLILTSELLKCSLVAGLGMYDFPYSNNPTALFFFASRLRCFQVS